MKIYTSKNKKLLFTQKIDDLNVKNNKLQELKECLLNIGRVINTLQTKFEYNIEKKL